MKKLLFSLISALAVLTVQAQTNMNTNTVATAPVNAVTSIPAVGGAGVVLSSGTSSIDGSAEAFYYTNTPTINCTYSRNVAITMTGALTTSGTDAITFVFDRSDGSQWTPAVYSFSLTPNGTTAQTISTNLDVGGFMQLRLNSITNSGAAAKILTNFTVSVSMKRGM